MDQLAQYNHSFRTGWWLPSGHGQTIWPMVARRVPLDLRTEKLELPDGDFVRLDWVGHAGPIVSVLPGLQGDIRSACVRGLMRAFGRHGWRGVLLNYRGCGEPNRLPYSYHCGRTDDLDYLVDYLRNKEPQTPIGVVGYSLGANICLKWLGENGRRGQSLPIAAAAGVSPPFYLGAVARRIERGLSRIYQRRLLKSLRRDLLRKMQRIDLGLGLTREQVHRLRTFFQFDSHVTAPLNGFEHAEDYYSRTRSDRLLPYVQVPTLLVNALNDPLVPAELIPRPEDVSAKVTLEVTRGGGHMGFVGGLWPWRPKFWIEHRIPQFLSRFLHAATPEVQTQTSAAALS